MSSPTVGGGGTAEADVGRGAGSATHRSQRRPPFPAPPDSSSPLSHRSSPSSASPVSATAQHGHPAVAPASATPSPPKGPGDESLGGPRLRHLAMCDTTDQPDQVVSRAAYLDVLQRLADERAAFLREIVLLRQTILRLEVARAAARDDRGGGGGGGGAGASTSLASMAAAVPSPTTAAAGASGGGGSATQLALLQRATAFANAAAGGALVVSAADGDTPDHEQPRHPPAGALQLLSLREATDALHFSQLVEAVREAAAVALDRREAEHERQLEAMLHERAMAVAAAQHETDIALRRVDALKNTMTVERQRFRNLAEAAAKAQLDEATLRGEKLAHQVQQLERELHDIQSDASALRAEDQRKNSVIAQLQQQLSVLMEERSEMRNALQTVSVDQQRQQIREQTLLSEVQSLRDAHANARRESAAGGWGEAPLGSGTASNSASGNYTSSATTLHHQQQQQLRGQAQPSALSASSSAAFDGKRPSAFAAERLRRKSRVPQPPPASAPTDDTAGGGAAAVPRVLRKKRGASTTPLTTLASGDAPLFALAF